MAQTVTVAFGEDEHELASSLSAWLMADDDVRRYGGLRRRAVTTTPGPRDTRYMGTLEIIEFVVGAGLSAAGLVVEIINWRREREDRPVIVLQIGDKEIRIDTDDPDRGEEIARDIGN
jgi:hypothetical protein